MEKGTKKTKTKKQPITVSVTVSKELDGVEIAKHLLKIGVYNNQSNEKLIINS